MHHIWKGFVLLALFLLGGTGCSSSPAPPGPGEATGALPDLRSRTVMVLPVQLKRGVPRGVLADSELAHALRTRGEAVSWVFPPELEEALERSPGVPARITGLPVQFFLQAQVNRVGDPLFGHLYRLAGLTGADVALIPVELRYGEAGTYTLAAALVATRNGSVAWYGVMEGEPGGAEDPATLASLAERMARALLPLG